MKKSELKNEIKDYVYEILSEEPMGEVTMVGPDTETSDIPSIAKSERTNPATVKSAIDQAKKTKQAVQVAEGKVWKTSEFEEIQNAIYTIEENLYVFRDEKIESMIEKWLGEISYLTQQYGTENINESEDDDSSPDDDAIDKQAKAAAKKEKVNTPSKFKVPNSEFEDFKTRLKNLVKKIKDMEKGDEKDKKMAALKQFIKKPELVKAFKERDVQIDTGGLIGENKSKKH